VVGENESTNNIYRWLVTLFGLVDGVAEFYDHVHWYDSQTRATPSSKSIWGFPLCGLLEFRVVGHGVVDVHRKRILDVLRIDVGAEFVVDQLDHLVERVTLGRPDVVDALQFVIGCELAGANDVVDVREVPCLAPVAEQFRAVTVGESCR